MRYRFYAVRAIELLIAFGSCLLAVQSFFSSWLYETINMNVSNFLIRFGLQFLPSIVEVDQILPLFISVLVVLVNVYNGLLGKSGNIMSLYNINMMLISPEILGYSKLDWFKLFDIPTVLEPRRETPIVLLTCLLIVGGYTIQYFTSKYRQELSEYGSRGIEKDELDLVLYNQSIVSIVLMVITVAVVASFSYAVPFLRSQLHSAVGDLPSIYVVLGVASTLIATFSLRVFLRERLEKENEVKTELETKDSLDAL